MDKPGAREPIPSLPGTFRLGLDHIVTEIEECLALGIESFILFPVVREELKDQVASYSFAEDNFYLKACRAIKDRFPEVCLISDVAMDPYSSDGHDGLVRDGKILNDESLPILSKMAVAQASAGFDFIGPSDMMDGRVAHIRRSLDDHNYTETGIISYSAKYASAFYGPFRDALNSAPKAGDKKTYQMDPANRSEAILEAQLDIEEGADMVMVKPAVPYLDIISDLHETSEVPVVAYHVSGECAMIWAAAHNGWLDLNKTVEETLISIRRAGANSIITYFAKRYAEIHA